MQPRQSYLVCATPRSGSTFLCEALCNTGIAGFPEEYFEVLKETGLPRQPQEYFSSPIDSEIIEILGRPSLRRDTAWLTQWSGPSYANYLAESIKKGTTPNGVFGAKMMWGYFADFISLVQQISAYKDMSYYDLLASIFPNVRYIWITRQDKQGQAVSLWKAIQTQRWRQDSMPLSADGSSPKKELIFHFAAIAYLEQRIVAHEAAWQQYFKAGSIQPLVIVYEALVKDYETTLRKALDYLEIPLPKNLVITRPRMERQANAHSEEWLQRYRQLKQAKGEGCIGDRPPLT